MAPFELLSSSPGIALVSEASGWLLEVPATAKLSDVISLRATGEGALRVSLGANAEALLVLEVVGVKAKVSVDISLGDEATCDITCLQMVESSAECFIMQSSTLGSGATLRSRHVSLGAKHSTHQVTAKLLGRDARSDIEWMAYAKGDERCELRAVNTFENGNGRGEITMKGVAEGKAHLQERGVIEIGLQGRGTDAYLTQDVLMLDPTAKVDAVPGLEIKTNDVKASHSATVSRVTQEDLFTFGARGITPHEARRMYVLGFLGQLTQGIRDAELREKVVGAIEAKYAL
jgi:Fe-S cluster assembly protein SufD